MTAVLRVSGAWREGDPPGDRRFLDVPGPLALELGGTLPGYRLAYETWGRLSPARDNAVLVLHALTGDSHVVGEAGPGHPTAGWWNAVVGPGLGIDTNRFFVVCANVIGGCQGTTGPSSAAPDGRPWGSRWPRTTIRDQVAAEVPLADALGVDVWHGVVGGSMGGMRALEWAVMRPHRVRNVVVLAAAAEASADQVGLCRIQIDAIRADPYWCGGDYHDQFRGPDGGLGIARRIAHLSYRTAGEMDTRFGRAAQNGMDPLRGGLFAVESYLDHAAEGLRARFDAGSYVALNLAMNSHEIGRNRGGTAAALARVTARPTVVGVDTDRLYPLHQQAELAALLGTEPDIVSSGRGHDGFLVETDQVGAVLARALG
ncbi:homoserine O-acetyltransferase MetX [Pseudonocardia asaccharolytica]|uniref:Homoserine O-acetyltransferase n=1 Tax=Pseudonocardia asaccharolytica DSM 44247 = NBRC 16224 TaxID=1123024 RepID=A0A511D9K3_9PSEU|nr:homoserine O-acetyltransferase [Pseudonocardia asaccharolytica]GEL20314.1 homoserine O-acetyltransferase [Pseudonocardia asaccharolytica DSM 44247 = NBRC 16224]